MDAELIAFNDTFRTTFKGGLVCMTPSVYELDRQLRGRAFDRLTRVETFTQDDHSEGQFLFAGYTFIWKIELVAGYRTLTLALDTDFGFSLERGHPAHFL